jgi:hypothetical protein
MPQQPTMTSFAACAQTRPSEVGKEDFDVIVDAVTSRRTEPHPLRVVAGRNRLALGLEMRQSGVM